MDIKSRPVNALHLAIAVCIATIFSALFIGSPLATQNAYANSDNGKASRAIAIAYDNSGSMLEESKWCAAKYSLEVIAAMLDENDTMDLFVMDSNGPENGGDGSKHMLTINGNSDIKERVESIHGLDLGYSYETGPKAAEDALEYLKGISPDRERFLIITTDGVFTVGDRFEGIQKTVADAKENGIKVIYFTIGKEASEQGEIDEDRASGILAKSASSSDSILATMVEIANQVFGRDALPDSLVDNNSGTLSFDVPMSELIVFAQGENVKVGNLVTADNQTISGISTRVSYSEYATEISDGTKKGTPNRELQGIVCVYRGEIPKGEARLDIEGAHDIEVYYTPDVGIAVDLIDDKADEKLYELKPDEATKLIADTYKPSPHFIDRKTGEIIVSDLLKDPSFNLSVAENGSERKLGMDESLTIEVGEIILRASATTNGTVRIPQNEYRIIASEFMTMDTSALPPLLPIIDFDKQRYEIKLKKTDGAPFTDAQWADLEFSITDSADIEWDYQKIEPGIISVAPKWINDDPWATTQHLLGPVPIEANSSNLHMVAQISGNKAHRVSADHSIVYAGDWADFMKHVWPFLLLFLILLYLIYKYLTKPRLPRKIRPYVVIASQDEPVALSYNEANIRNKFSPWGPETITFNARTPKDPIDAQNLRLTERYELSRIGLVGAKKEGGKRRFKFDEQTLSDMRRHITAAQEREESREQGFPDPDYSPKPAKSFKDQGSRGIGSTLTFVGYNIPPRGKKKQEETYTLYFRKPQ